jgi:hypothetical protein
MPKEGDLVFMPTQRKLMEIRFVERDMSFFQLGKVVPYMYGLSTETFKYNGEFINTGIEEIDLMGDESALSIQYNVAPTSTASFARGEVAFQGANVSSNVFGIVVSYDRPAGELRLRNIRGQFSNTAGANTITGHTSGATATLIDYNILNNATIIEGEIGDNEIIEEEAKLYLDFSESNPFGSP